MTTEPNELSEASVSEAYLYDLALKSEWNLYLKELRAYVSVRERSQTNKTIQRIIEGLPERIPVQNAAHCSGCSSNSGYNHALAQVRELLDKEKV